jgi:hypothetical protein
MGTIARGTKSANGTINFGANTIAKSAEVNTDLNTIVSVINGNLDDDNLDLSSISQTVGFEGIFTAASLNVNNLTSGGLVVSGTAAFDGLLTAASLTVDNLKVVVLGSYTTNALAIAAGLTVGNLYRNGDYLGVVH